MRAGRAPYPTPDAVVPKALLYDKERLECVTTSAATTSILQGLVWLSWFEGYIWQKRGVILYAVDKVPFGFRIYGQILKSIDILIVVSCLVFDRVSI
jgi:hypothetical protein